MTRETASEKTNTHTYVVIVEDDVAHYLDEQRITDTNAYMIQLLQAEKQRQKGAAPKSAQAEEQTTNQLSAQTPNTAG
jgi:hypothetical protein